MPPRDTLSLRWYRSVRLVFRFSPSALQVTTVCPSQRGIPGTQGAHRSSWVLHASPLAAQSSTRAQPLASSLQRYSEVLHRKAPPRKRRPASTPTLWPTDRRDRTGSPRAMASAEVSATRPTSLAAGASARYSMRVGNTSREYASNPAGES